MRADQLERTGTLVYDADCGFCTRYAKWVGHSMPWQELDLDAVGTTADAMRRAAGWLVEDRLEATGAAAIAASLVRRGGRWNLLGHALQLPLVRFLADVVYTLVARNRHRLPGGTNACRVPTAEKAAPPWAVRGALMTAILVAGLVSLGMDNNHGSQPYPGLILPGFGYNPTADDGTVTTTVVEYRVTMPDGHVLAVRAGDLLPTSGPATYALAQRLTSSPSRVEMPAVRHWFARQVDRSARTRGAESLTVVDVARTYTANGHLVDRSATPRMTLELRR